MNELTNLVVESLLPEPLRLDILLLLGEISPVEKLRVKKAVELEKFGLLKLILLRYGKRLKELKNSQGLEEEGLGEESRVNNQQEVLQENIEIITLESLAKFPTPKIVTELQLTPSKHVTLDSDFSWKQLIASIEQARPNTIAVESLLKDPEYLGQSIEQLPTLTTEIPELLSIYDISDYRQIEKLDTQDVTFFLDENPEQKLFLLRDKLLKILGKKITIGQRRAVFLLFLHSPLFYKYSFTGLAALNVQSDLPRKIMLNVLHQNDDRFLNLAEFEWTAKLVKTLREVCII